jgi:hypothetical protein
LHCLGRLAHKARKKWDEAAKRCLLADGNDFRAAACKVSGDSQKQWACSSYNHPFAGYWQASAHHCVEAAGAHDIRKRPAGERQEALACAGGKNQLFVTEVAASAIPFR